MDARPLERCAGRCEHQHPLQKTQNEIQKQSIAKSRRRATQDKLPYADG